MQYYCSDFAEKIIYGGGPDGGEGSVSSREGCSMSNVTNENDVVMTML
jgi:hypothetical protein